MMTREQFLAVVENTGLARVMGQLQKAIIGRVAEAVGQGEKPDPKALDEMLLNSVGPAAADAAVSFALNRCHDESKFLKVPKGGGVYNTVKLVQNDLDAGGVEGYQSFSNVLREFLLPRYAYLDFDKVVDPRHQIDLECGYPKFITPIMYRYMYDRDDIARRVVDIYPDESWAARPQVYEIEDEDAPETPFEAAWRVLVEQYNVIQYLYRLDRLCGIGHYGVLLLGVGDGKDLEAPIDEQELLAGMRGTVGTQTRPLLYMRPFDEYLSFIHQYETDVLHPRYGLPKFYNLVFLDMTIDAAGASIGTRLNRRVHWTRVVHAADNLQSSLVFGIPRQQPVFNRLLDLRKIKGGSAEMFWKGAFPGLSFEVDPQYVADQPNFDQEEFREEIRRYSDGLQRYLAFIGISAKSLAPQVADPEKHVRVQMEAVAAHFGIPYRIFLGAEEGRLASSEDKLTWNNRLGRRCRMFVEPGIIRNFLDRLIAIGVIPPPATGRYFVDWGDLNTSTDEDKANLALKWTQALSQYVATGLIHCIGPLDYFTIILGLKPADAKRIIQWVEENGGWEKLKKVDPSQGAGVNGKRENIAGKAGDAGADHETHKKRDTADKKAEGMTS